MYFDKKYKPFDASRVQIDQKFADNKEEIWSLSSLQYSSKPLLERPFLARIQLDAAGKYEIPQQNMVIHLSHGVVQISV